MCSMRPSWWGRNSFYFAGVTGWRVSSATSGAQLKRMGTYTVPTSRLTKNVSPEDGTLFEHFIRAIEKGLTAGAHGLPSLAPAIGTMA